MGRTLEDVVEELYALPPADFTDRRTALAKELRAEDRELGAAVGKLPKPAVSAWALNRYARERGDDLDELLSLGGQLREAQSELAGDRLRSLMADAHALVQRTLDGVTAVASEGGSPLSSTLLGQVEQTLRAALADEDAAAAVRAGVLAKPLAPAGFGPVDLSGAVALTPTARGGKAPTVPPTRAKRPAADDRLEAARQAAEGALAELERTEAQLEAREAELQRASEEHDTAVRRRDEVQAALDEARAALEEAEQQTRAAAGRLRDAEKERERAARATAKATEAAAQAKAAVDALT